MTNYNKQNIENMLFLDIETVREFNTFADFTAAKDFEKWKRFAVKYYGDLLAKDAPSDEDVYLGKASLHPEYAKVVSVSFGFMRNDTKSVYAITNSDENLLLSKLAEQLTKAHEKNLNTLISGHNVLEFDIPFLIKRMIKHGIKIPVILQNIINSKPWETKVIDTMRDWKMNSSKLVSLDVIAEFLNIPSPKTGVVNGSNLSEFYWSNGESSLPAITEYCKKDVETSMEIVHKLSQV